MKVRENDVHNREKSWESQGKKIQHFAMNPGTPFRKKKELYPTNFELNFQFTPLILG